MLVAINTGRGTIGVKLLSCRPPLRTAKEGCADERLDIGQSGGCDERREKKIAD
jgi:hypothetical protein